MAIKHCGKILLSILKTFEKRLKKYDDVSKENSVKMFYKKKNLVVFLVFIEHPYTIFFLYLLFSFYSQMW